MHQLATDLNRALNDKNTLTSSLTNFTMIPSSFARLSKERRKHARNNEISEIIEETSRCLNISECDSLSQIAQHHVSNRNGNHSSITGPKQKPTVCVNKHNDNNSLSNMAYVDDFKMNTSLNSSTSLLSNEDDDEQPDCSQNESNITNIISWWDENEQGNFDNEIDYDEVLKTSDETLQKIVNGALHLMSDDSTTKLRKRIKTLVNRKRLIRNPRNIRSKSNHIDSHFKRNSRLSESNDIDVSIGPANLGHQLLEKIGWTPGNGLGLNQNGRKTPIPINFRHHRQGLGYENQSIHPNESSSNHSKTFPN